MPILNFIFLKKKNYNTTKTNALFLCLFSMFFLTACSNINFTNPFIGSTHKTAIASGTYSSKFKNIPIPVDMVLDESKTYIATSLDGKVMGLETYEGKVEITALAHDMNNIMQREGWALKGSVSVTKTIQVYEADGLFAIIYYYNQALSTAMEIWVMNVLSNIPHSPI